MAPTRGGLAEDERDSNSDENSAAKSGGDDMRCLLEARLAGLQPTAVIHQAETLEKAVDGAVEKLKRSLESTLGRLDDR